MNTPNTHNPPWLVKAMSQAGIRETRGGETPQIMRYHAKVDPSGAWLNEDEDPWCASFASWVLDESGMVSPLTARARDFLGYGEELGHWRRGCLVVLSRGSNPAHGHVGFVLDVVGDQVVVLGGNQSDSVNVAIYPASRLLGWRWPVPVGGDTPPEV